MKGRIYQTCVRSAMRYGSETWCLRENEVAILRQTESAMIKAMCGVKLMDKKNTEELMVMLGLKETIDKLAKANGVCCWYIHVLRREKDDILRKALCFKVEGQRRRGRLRKTWKNQVEDDIRKIGLKKKDALNRSKWRKRCEDGHVENGVNPANLVNRDKTGSKLVYYYYYNRFKFSINQLLVPIDFTL